MHNKMNDFFLDYISSEVEIITEDSLSDFMSSKVKGVMNAINCENLIYQSASEVSKDYGGGTWEFRELKNGGFFMFPKTDATYTAQGYYYETQIDGRILGLAACMKAFSIGSFIYSAKGNDEVAVNFSNLYHKLRDAFYSGVDELAHYEDAGLPRNPDVSDEDIEQIKEMGSAVYRILD